MKRVARDDWLHDIAGKICRDVTLTLDAVFASPLDRGLRDRSLQRRYHRALSGAFVLIESGVRALQEFLWRFAGGVVGPAAGILQAHFFVVEFEFEAFEARRERGEPLRSGIPEAWP